RCALPGLANSRRNSRLLHCAISREIPTIPDLAASKPSNVNVSDAPVFSRFATLMRLFSAPVNRCRNLRLFASRGSVLFGQHLRLRFFVRVETRFVALRPR